MSELKKSEDLNKWDLFLLIPVLLISLLFTKYFLNAEKCFGIIDVFYQTVFIFLLFGIGCITLVIQVVKIFRRKKKFRLALLSGFTIVLMALPFLVSYIPQDLLRAESMFKAKLQPEKDILAINFRVDSSCSILYGHIDWSCLKESSFRINQDTIILKENIRFANDTLVFQKYLIADNRYLFPISNNQVKLDSALRLFIN